MKITGQIVVGPFATDSKSEREAVYLKTDSGSFLLQKENENPFERSSLLKLEGQKVTVEGELNKYLLLAKEVNESK